MGGQATGRRGRPGDDLRPSGRSLSDAADHGRRRHRPRRLRRRATSPTRRASRRSCGRTTSPTFCTWRRCKCRSCGRIPSSAHGSTSSAPRSSSRPRAGCRSGRRASPTPRRSPSMARADLYPPGPLADDAPLAPVTLYGVTKEANEGWAAIYWQDYAAAERRVAPLLRLWSRPRPGRQLDADEGDGGRRHGSALHISFGGTDTYQHADDVATGLHRRRPHQPTARRSTTSAARLASVADVVAAIERAVPGERRHHHLSTLSHCSPPMASKAKPSKSSSVRSPGDRSTKGSETRSTTLRSRQRRTVRRRAGDRLTRDATRGARCCAISSARAGLSSGWP